VRLQLHWSHCFQRLLHPSTNVQNHLHWTEVQQCCFHNWASFADFVNTSAWIGWFSPIVFNLHFLQFCENNWSRFAVSGETFVGLWLFFSRNNRLLTKRWIGRVLIYDVTKHDLSKSDKTRHANLLLNRWSYYSIKKIFE